MRACFARNWGGRALRSSRINNRFGSERLLSCLDQQTQDLLLDCNRLDLELYEYGQALFRQHFEHRAEASRNRKLGRLPPAFGPERNRDL